MAEVEIKRGYEVLPDNNIRFGIRVTNTDGLVITDVEVTLYYPESLFSLEADRHQNLGNISPASTRTAEFLLKPLGCVHEENIEAHISYRDPKGHRHSVDMQPKAPSCDSAARSPPAARCALVGQLGCWVVEFMQKIEQCIRRNVFSTLLSCTSPPTLCFPQSRGK